MILKDFDLSRELLKALGLTEQERIKTIEISLNSESLVELVVTRYPSHQELDKVTQLLEKAKFIEVQNAGIQQEFEE